MKKTIMIIGGGLLQVPVIQTAKKMGLQVIVTDRNSGTAGMKYADIPIVMSTRDVEGSVWAAKKQNYITPISAVLTVGTDASMAVAAVADALKLPGIKFEDAEASTNKIKMRTRFKEHGVPSPEFVPIQSLKGAKSACKKLGFPVVIKPSDNMGARGVVRINNKNDITAAFQYAKDASNNGDLIIEEYMEGPELSIDAVIYNGRTFITGIADRIIRCLPYFVETGHTMPSQLSIETTIKAAQVMQQGIEALGINIGCAKGDIKLTQSGPMVGEIAARLSGGFMSTHTFPLATGIDLMEAAIKVALGESPGILIPTIDKVSIERAIIPEPEIVKDIEGLHEAAGVPGIEEIFLNVSKGDKVVKPRSNVDKAGHVIATGGTLEEAEFAVKRFMKILKIKV